MSPWDRTRLRAPLRVAFVGCALVIAALSARVVENLRAAPPNDREFAGAAEPPDAPGPPAPDSEPLAWLLAIARGGLFHTVTDAAATPETATPETADTCPPSPGPLSLLATMAAEPPTWSMAIVADGGPDTRLVKEGQALGDYTVHTIARERLVLARGGRYECIALGPRRRTPTVSSARDTSSAPGSAATPSGEIRPLGNDRYIIPRRFVSDLMDHPESVSGEARAVPHFRNGQASGFKLVGVRRGGLLGQLGVRSGDVLVGVDGAPVRSANDVLKVYARLPETDHLSLELERRGRRRTVEIELP